MGDMKSKVFYGGLLMKITVSFTVHIYAEERLCDELLIPHSENYGIVGEEIIEPLRIINNRKLVDMGVLERLGAYRNTVYTLKNGRKK